MTTPTPQTGYSAHMFNSRNLEIPFRNYDNMTATNRLYNPYEVGQRTILTGLFRREPGQKLYRQFFEVRCIEHSFYSGQKEDDRRYDRYVFEEKIESGQTVKWVSHYRPGRSVLDPKTWSMYEDQAEVQLITQVEDICSYLDLSLWSIQQLRYAQKDGVTAGGVVQDLKNTVEKVEKGFPGARLWWNHFVPPVKRAFAKHEVNQLSTRALSILSWEGNVCPNYADARMTNFSESP